MRLQWIPWLLVGWIAATAYGDDIFTVDDNIGILSTKTFDKILTANFTASLVLFYAPYCKKTKEFAPTFISLSQRFEGIAAFAVMDCSDTYSHEICRRYDIENFPTIKLFPPDAQHHLKHPQTFFGTRTARDLGSAIKKLVTERHVHKLGPEEGWESIAANASRFRVLLFTEKSETTLLYKSLAWRYHHLAFFYEIHRTNEPLVKRFDIERFPTIVVIKEDKTLDTYRGALGAPPLIVFLDRMLEMPRMAIEFESNLYVLQTNDLEKIDQDEEIWLVAFLADPEGSRCVESITLLDASAKRIREIIRVGVFNLTAHPLNSETASELGIRPSKMRVCEITVVRFPFGTDKSETDEYEIYKGEMESKPLHDFALEANEFKPTKLDLQTIPAFLQIANAGQKSPTPKVLLFSSLETCPPIFAALAMSLRHWMADFGFVPQSATQIREEFQIKEVPALIMFHVDPTAEEGKQIMTPMYKGPIRFSSMKGWLEAAMITLKVGKREHDDPFFVAAERQHVTQIMTDDGLASVCSEAVPLCVIIVLDGGHEKFQTHLEAMERIVLQKTTEPSPFSFGWIDAKDGKQLLHDFGVGIGDVPSWIVYSSKRRRYTTLKRTNDATEVSNFLANIVSGSQQTYPIQETPKLKADNSQPIFTEEEIDLNELKDVEIENDAETKKVEL